jgi:hypothetical protein
MNAARLKKAIPKNVYTKVCINPACKNSFTCNHGNRRFCTERCKRNYERDLKKKDREKEDRIGKLMNNATRFFNEVLAVGKDKISKEDLKKRNIDSTIYIARVRSLKGDIIYVYKEHLLHKVSEDEFIISKIN